jgi:hypothetical protein
LALQKRKKLKIWRAAKHLQHFPYSYQILAFFDSSDRKWIFAENKMRVQKDNKRQPSAATLEQYQLTHTTFTHLSFHWTLPLNRRADYVNL